jgi:mannose-6-phosphate isomerase-like protein (cupin superfamily)
MAYSFVDNEEQPILDAGPGIRSRVLAGASNGAHHMSVVERWLDPGAVVEAHRHPGEVEEAIWVRAGEMEIRIEDEIAVVGPDATVVVPPLATHTLRAVGGDELYVLSRWSAAVPLTVLDDGAEGAPEIPGAAEA